MAAPRLLEIVEATLRHRAPHVGAALYANVPAIADGLTKRIEARKPRRGWGGADRMVDLIEDEFRAFEEHLQKAAAAYLEGSPS